MSLDLLTGETVRLLPYDEHTGFGEGFFCLLWKKCADQGLLSRICLAPEDRLGVTVQRFCAMLSGQPLLVVEDKVSHDLLGFVWYDGLLVAPHRGNINICYFKEAWGARALEASPIALWYGFNVLGLHYIWACTPWKGVVKHAIKVGFTYAAMLPRYLLIGDKALDVHMLWKENESWVPSP